MKNDAVVAIIKATVQSLLPDARILLFGSRAKGNPRQDSDYDLLVVTDRQFSDREKISWRTKLNKQLVHSINAPVDVLLNSEKEVAVKKMFPGHIIQWALKEGTWL